MNKFADSIAFTVWLLVAILMWLFVSFLIYVCSGSETLWKDALTGEKHIYLSILVYWWLPALPFALNTYEYVKERY